MSSPSAMRPSGICAKHRRFVEPAGAEVRQNPLRLDVARRDRVDAQALPRPLDRHRSGQALERRLRRRIEGKAGHRPAGGDAADVDDRAAPSVFDRPLGHRPRAVQRPDRVDGEEARGLGRLHVDQRRRGEIGGVVDQDVEPRRTGRRPPPPSARSPKPRRRRLRPEPPARHIPSRSPPRRARASPGSARR